MRTQTEAHRKEDDFPIETYSDKINIKVEPQLSLKDSILGIPCKWHRFSMVYRSEGDENFFLVGNFIRREYTNQMENPLVNKTVKAGKHTGQKFECYNETIYYIDDFSVFKITNEDECILKE